jgi:hypothetical protein
MQWYVNLSSSLVAAHHGQASVPAGVYTANLHDPGPATHGSNDVVMHLSLGEALACAKLILQDPQLASDMEWQCNWRRAERRVPAGTPRLRLVRGWRQHMKSSATTVVQT